MREAGRYGKAGGIIAGSINTHSAAEPLESAADLG